MIYSKIDYFENSIYFDDNNNQKINFDVESIGNDIVKLQYHCQIWNIRDFLNEMFKKEIRNIKLDIIEGIYIQYTMRKHIASIANPPYHRIIHLLVSNPYS